MKKAHGIKACGSMARFSMRMEVDALLARKEVRHEIP